MNGIKSISLEGSREALSEFIQALRRYAHAAWPPGGSECAQASRESLLTLCEALETDLDSDPTCLKLHKRQRSLFRSALEFHLDHDEFISEHALYRNLLEQLNARKTS